MRSRSSLLQWRAAYGRGQRRGLMRFALCNLIVASAFVLLVSSLVFDEPLDGLSQRRILERSGCTLLVVQLLVDWRGAQRSNAQRIVKGTGITHRVRRMARGIALSFLPAARFSLLCSRLPFCSCRSLTLFRGLMRPLFDADAELDARDFLQNFRANTKTDQGRQGTMRHGRLEFYMHTLLWHMA